MAAFLGPQSVKSFSKDFYFIRSLNLFWLIAGYETVFDNGSALPYFTWILLVGLIASFHSFLFCCGRLLYAISRDGLFPSPLSIVSQRLKTPYVALATGSLVSFGITIILYYAIDDPDNLGSVMINLALLGEFHLGLRSLLILEEYCKHLGRTSW